MYSLTQLKQATILFFIVLLGFWFLPVQAVVPPPNGGYPSFNTAEGTNALKNLTTGAANTAVGWYSLFSNTDGSFNTAVGAGTLLFNVGDQSTSDGVDNTAIGTAALLFNAIGSDNTAVGTAALVNNDADANTAFGSFALNGNTTGIGNTAVGASALLDNTTGSFSTATGFGALIHNNANSNTANGTLALQNNTTGSANTAIGGQALQSNQVGSDNTATGYQALFHTTGEKNSAIGSGALASNTDGGDNVAVGYQALPNITTGSANTALGSFAGNALTADDSFNTDIDNQGVAGDNNTIRIGFGFNERTFIAGIYGTTLNGNGAAVYVDNTGQLGTNPSARRYKKEIEPMDKTSEAILALKPVTFHYKSDVTNTPQFGLVAEEVAEVNSALVVRDKSGEIYTVRYDAVNAMLLNEFLKEHRKVEELEANVSEQRKEMKALATTVKEQASLIQRVSAQLELGKSAPETALSSR